MFKIEITTLDARVLFAFGQLFNDLAGQAQCGTLSEMTGTEYLATIDKDDVPSTGRAINVGDKITGNSELAGATIVRSLTPNLTDAASVFGAAPLAPPAPSTAAVGQAATAQEATQATLTKTTDNPTPAQVFGSQDAIAADPTPDITPVLLDKNGLPWDMRIHAGTRTQTAKGEWKSKRGVDDATVAQVTAELRQALAAPRTPFAPLNAPSPPNTVVQAAPQPPTVSAPSPSAQTAPAIDFVGLCQYVGTHGVKAERVIQVCERHGIAGLAMTNLRPDLIPAIYADFVSGV